MCVKFADDFLASYIILRLVQRSNKTLKRYLHIKFGEIMEKF